jgi:hypothetical protein
MASTALAKIFGMWSRPLSLAVLLAFCGTGTQVLAADSNLLVEEAVGAVKLRMSDRWETPVAGTAVVLPAVVSTGDDGSARLRQNETVISVAANTAIELLDNPGSGLLQRAVQDRGSAFYDIAPQGSSRFRVETPFLVAVIKGTQFNVTVSDDVSSVSLFEGQLRIEAPDVGDAVDLTAGQIAQRRKGDPRITVLSMENGEPVGRNDASKPGSSVSGSNDRNTRDPAPDGGSDSGDDLSVRIVSDDGSIIGSSGTTVTADGSIRLDDKELDATLDSKLGVGELANATLGVESSIDLESGETVLSADQTLDLGDSSIDTGLDAGVDLGDGQVDLGVDSALDLGGSSIETGVDAGLDLGDGTVDLGVEGALDLLDADVGVDLDSGIDLNLDLGSTGELLDVDLGIDPLGDTEDSTEVESDDTDTLLPNLGDLLGL